MIQIATNPQPQQQQQQQETTLQISSTSSSNQQLNSSHTPPSYLRWSSSLDDLLNDELGRKMFTEYLKATQNDNLYTLYMTLKCFVAQGEEEKLKKIFEITYNSCYVKQEMKFDNELIQKKLRFALEKKQFDLKLFDKCAQILKDHLNNEYYPKFLNSDLYKRVILWFNNQNCVSYDQQFGSESIDEQVKHIIDFIQNDKTKFLMPDVPFNQHTTTTNGKTTSKQPSSTTKTKSKSKSKLNESNLSKKSLTYQNKSTPHIDNPYKVITKAIPVSAQDSEIQSLSSDALTEDNHYNTIADDLNKTGKTTDDSKSRKSKNKIYKEMKEMKQSAELNRNVNFNDLNMPDQHLPRTKIEPDAGKEPLSQKNPAAFFKLLCDKLEKVILNETNSNENYNNNNNNNRLNVETYLTQTQTNGVTNHTSKQQVQVDIDAERMLDEHVDRVFSNESQNNEQHQHLTPQKLQQQQQQLKRKPFTSKSGTELQYFNLSTTSQSQLMPQPLNSANTTLLQMSYMNTTNPKLNSSSSLMNKSLSAIQQQQQIFHIASTTCKEVDIDENSSFYGDTKSRRTQQSAQSHQSKGAATTSTSNKSSIDINYDSGVSMRSVASIERVSDWLQTSSANSYHQQQQQQQQQPTSSHHHQPHHHHHHTHPSQQVNNTSQQQPTLVMSHIPNLQPTPTLQLPPQQQQQQQQIQSNIHEPTMSCVKTTVAYYLPGEDVPYMTSFNGVDLKLSQFKQLITKKGAFRYFFKTKSTLLDDQECTVFQEVSDDGEVVPLYNDKVIAKIERQ